MCHERDWFRPLKKDEICLYSIPKQKILSLDLRDNVQQVNGLNRVCTELLFFFQVLLWKSNNNLFIWENSTLTCSKNHITSHCAIGFSQAEENYFQNSYHFITGLMSILYY